VAGFGWPARGLYGGGCGDRCRSSYGGTRRPGIALGFIAAAAFAIAVRTTMPVALATGAMGWLFYAGFVTGRHAQLAWHGAADIQRAGILLGVAFCGAAASWIHAWVGTRRAALAEPAPVRLAPVVSLADARCGRHAGTGTRGG